MLNVLLIAIFIQARFFFSIPALNQSGYKGTSFPLNTQWGWHGLSHTDNVWN